MKIFTPLIGRFGNQMFQYAYARAYCENSGYELCTDRWVGEKVFNLPDASGDRSGAVRFQENYRQNQESLIYTRDQLKQWFRFRPEMEPNLKWRGGIVCHRRVGDYKDLGIPIVSKDSYFKAAEKFFLGGPLNFCTEEDPTTDPEFSGDLAFIPDFFRMMNANVLLRSNSTFSWWGAALGDCRVFSPIINGLGSGEYECEFVEGNHPRTFNADFVTDLFLK